MSFSSVFGPDMALTLWRCILLNIFLGLFQFNPLYSQTRQLPVTPNPISKMMPSSGNAEAAITSLNDTREVLSKIQAQKAEMEELKQEVNHVRTFQPDSVQYDSLVQNLKIKVLDHSRSQLDMLSELGEMVDDAGLKNSISYVQSNIGASSQTLEGQIDLKEIGDYIDLSEENMKALVDEHIIGMASDPLEEFIGTTGIKGDNSILGSFYSNGLEAYLAKSKEGEIAPVKLEKSEVQWKIIESGKGVLPKRLVGNGAENKVKSIKDINLAEIDPKKSKEPNQYKGKPFFSRMNSGIYYDALQSISEGVHVQGHFGWRVNNHIMPYAGLILKKPWKEERDNNREGYGYQGGLRMDIGNWFGQAGIERTFSRNRFQNALVKEEFEGWVIYPIISGGRKVTITKSLRTVFLGYVDPLYTKNKTNRLHSHMFGLKIGIELN